MPSATDRKVTCSIPGCSQVHYPNVPLIRKVYEHVVAHPEEWNQGLWARRVTTIKSQMIRDQLGRFLRSNKEVICKTQFCIAGHAANMTGYQLFSEPTHNGEEDADYLQERDANGDQLTVHNVAKHELGLIDIECNLFGGSNTLREVKTYMSRLCRLMGEEL